MNADELRPGVGEDRVYAGMRNDTIFVAVDGSAETSSRRDYIDCGDGDDQVVLVDGQQDPRDEFVNCENVS